MEENTNFALWTRELNPPLARHGSEPCAYAVPPLVQHSG